LKPRLALVAATMLLMATLAGCGGDESSSSLDADVADAYVEATAKALCVVQSNAYATQAEQEAAYQDAFRSSSLSADELAQAREAAANDEELRTRISDMVEVQCG